MVPAEQILDGREAAEKNRLAFIIFLSDGDDQYLKEQDIPRAYPIHAFGVAEDDSHSALQTMADVTSGSYTSITTEDLDKITEKLDQLSEKLSSIVAIDMSIHLKSVHPGVSLLRIEPSAAGDASKSQISDDKQSADILVGAVSSGKEEEFTAYLYVPDGQGNASANGAMELLTVGGSYKQGWDQKQIALAESIVTVERPGLTPPAPSSSCKELDWIKDRMEYWCKVKVHLLAMYDKAEAEAGAKLPAGGKSKCQCQNLQVLRETTKEAINKAMHYDIYTATLIANKLRHCGCGGAVAAATEKAPSTPAQPAKAV